ncbi:MAG: hypothetical protein IJ607_02380 [Bacteroidaceae bacterium]|nr:hypothetical protein [Bacteroidaceae bacterium]
MTIMKTETTRTLMVLMTGMLLLFSSLSANAQNRNSRRQRQYRPNSAASKIRRPAAPSPLDVQERTIGDLLFFAYGCLPDEIGSSDEAKNVLESNFGSYETINLYEGLHLSDSYNYSYRGVPIGVCYADWYDNRHWYIFYFDTKSEAQQFYTRLVGDIKTAGIPLTKDAVYGSMSNRKRPVSIFKMVYVEPPVKVKEADESNIHLQNVVGQWAVELGVYKKK